MEQLYRFALYFIVGGFTTLGASYFNESGRGGTAALVASLPIFFLMTALIAYYTSGPNVAVDYAKGMILSNVPWLVAVVIFGYGIHESYNPILVTIVSMAMYLLIMFATSELV
jgi:hypothetical protein